MHASLSFTILKKHKSHKNLQYLKKDGSSICEGKQTEQRHISVMAMWNKIITLKLTLFQPIK